MNVKRFEEWCKIVAVGILFLHLYSALLDIKKDIKNLELKCTDNLVAKGENK